MTKIRLVVGLAILLLCQSSFGQRTVSIDVSGVLQGTTSRAIFLANSNLLDAAISGDSLSNITVNTFTTFGPDVRPAAKTITGTLTVTGTNSWTYETHTNFNWLLSGSATPGQFVRFTIKNTNLTADIFGTNATPFYRESLGGDTNLIQVASNSVMTLVLEYRTNFSGGSKWFLAQDGGFAHPLGEGINTKLATNSASRALSITATSQIETNTTTLGSEVQKFNFVAGITGALAGATANLGVVPLGAYRTFYIPAGSLVTNLTDGAVLKTEETGTNKKMRDYLEFSGTVTNGAGIGFRMPQEWNLGTMKVKFDWSSTNEASLQTNVWAISAGSVSDDEPVDNNFGTEVVVADVVTEANDQLLSPATPALTVGGSLAAEDFVDFKVRRLPGHALDNMSGVAKLYGIFIQYLERSNATTAW